MNADAASHALEKKVPKILGSQSQDHVARLIAEIVGVDVPLWGRDTNIIAR